MRCKVPWAGLGEAISHPISEELIKRRLMRLYSFDENRSFTPSCWPLVSSMHVYVQRIGSCQVRIRLRHNISWSYANPPRLFEPLPGAACCRARGADLECFRLQRAGAGTLERAISVDFFSRRAYHVFNHVHGHALMATHGHGCSGRFADSCAYDAMGDDIQAGPWVLSRLLRIALGEEAPISHALARVPTSGSISRNRGRAR